MKLSCEIVKDLLPLYEDGLCSQESRIAVEEHLEQCTSCAGECGRIRALEIPQIDPTEPKQEKAVVKSFRKVRRRWVASVLLVIVLLPLLVCAGWMGWNTYKGQGLTFTNLDEIYTATRFVRLLEQGEYEKAAQFLEYRADYESIFEVVGLAWEDELPCVQQVQIGEEIWMVDPEFADRYLQDTDPLLVWSGLIYNGADLALIPVDIFKTITDRSPAEGRWENSVYYTENGHTFAPFQTQWGSFMAEQNCWAELKRYESDPVMLCYLLELYPLRMYEDTLPQLESYAKEQWQAYQDWNAPYLDMSYEEYADSKRGDFVKQMKELRAQGLQIECKGFWDAYRIGADWIILLKVELRKGERRAEAAPHFSVNDGQLHIGAAAILSDPSNLNDGFLDAIM